MIRPAWASNPDSPITAARQHIPRRYRQRHQGRPKMKITTNGHTVEQVQQFVYLGSVIIEDCKCHEEVKCRIAIGKEAFSKQGELLRGKMKLELKKD